MISSRKTIKSPFIYCFLVLAMAQAEWLTAQEDTLRVEKEEILLSSQSMQNDTRLREYELRPIFKYMSPWHRTGILKLGYRPSVKTAPGNDFFTGIAHVLSLRYEKKVVSSSFSVALETGLRLHDVGDMSYDYRHLDKSQRLTVRYFDADWRNGSYYTSFFNTDLSFRYYYSQAERLKVEASGNNFAQSFLQFKLKDVLTYSRIRTFEIDQVIENGWERAQLQRVSDKKKWVVEPTYFMIGWGLQREIYRGIWLELQLSGGTRIPGRTKLAHLDNDFVYEANLMLGIALGKKRKLK